MNMHDDFADTEGLQKYLGEQLYKGRLMVLLGAGVSKHFRLPEWDELLAGMYAAQSFPEDPKVTNAQVKAENLRLARFPKDAQGFYRCVHDTLYASVNVDFKSLRSADTLAAVASLVMASKRGSAADVVTLNFDNLLEIYLSYHGFVTTSIHKDDLTWSNNADVRVYHMHGMLPHEMDASFQAQVLLDQASYSRRVGKESAPWNQLVQALMRTRTCLFIGMSGNDGNMDTIIHNVFNTHVAKSDGTKYWGVTLKTEDDDVARAKWEERGVFYQMVSDYDVGLPDFLFRICQRAAERHAAP